MKIGRLVGLMLVTGMALNLAVASAAVAEPEFKPTGATLKGSGDADTLEAGSTKIVCKENTSTGLISSPTLVSGITVTFFGCVVTNDKEDKCTVKSVGALAEGLILTKTLHGVLGLILPKGTGTGVGLLLLPVANKKFVEIESTKCSPSTTVLGNVAGEVTPVHVSQNTASLKFQPSGQGGTQGESIKEFDFSTGGLVVPELEAFGLLASQKTEEALVYSEAVEVT